MLLSNSSRLAEKRPQLYIVFPDPFYQASPLVYIKAASLATPGNSLIHIKHLIHHTCVHLTSFPTQLFFLDPWSQCTFSHQVSSPPLTCDTFEKPRPVSFKMALLFLTMTMRLWYIFLVYVPLCFWLMHRIWEYMVTNILLLVIIHLDCSVTGVSSAFCDQVLFSLCNYSSLMRRYFEIMQISCFSSHFHSLILVSSNGSCLQQLLLCIWPGGDLFLILSTFTNGASTVMKSFSFFPVGFFYSIIC